LRVGELRGSPNLLSVLGVPIVAGRALTAADSTAIAPDPAVINRSLAERLWPGGAALGDTLSLPQFRGSAYLVVGIASDVAFGSLTGPGSDVVVTTGPGMSAIVSDFVIRTDHPEDVAGMLRCTIKGQVVRVATGREVVARDIGRQRLGAWFFSGFGLAALLLGVGGAFGLVRRVRAQFACHVEMQEKVEPHAALIASVESIPTALLIQDECDKS
jgi:MacB-like periplasmic core domain